MKPVLTVFLNALRLLLINKHTLLKVLSIPLLILVFVEYYGADSEGGMVQFIGSLIDFTAYCYAAILTHRVLILGPDSVPSYGVFKPTNREFVFACHFIGIGILVSPIIIILFLIPNVPLEIITPVATLLFLYLVCRVSLVFPAIAVGKNWTYTDSWRATKNFKVISIFNIGLFPMLSSGIFAYLSHLLDIQLLTAIFSTISTVLIVAVLSSTYQHIEQNTSMDQQGVV